MEDGGWSSCTLAHRNAQRLCSSTLLYSTLLYSNGGVPATADADADATADATARMHGRRLGTSPT